jgi:hypothetical protein
VRGRAASDDAHARAERRGGGSLHGWSALAAAAGLGRGFSGRENFIVS